MGWEIFALIASLAGALVVQINRHYRLEGAVLVLLRSVFLVVLLAPVTALVPWPQGNLFYILAFIVGLMGLFADVVLFNAAARYGGRLTSLYMAIKILGGFFLWAFIDRAFLPALMENMFVFGAVLGCLSLSALALFLMRRSDVSWAALVAILPAGLMLTFADSLSKVAMQGEQVIAAAVVYTFLLGLTSLCGTALWYGLYRRDRLAELITPRALGAGAITGAGFALLLGCLTAAIALSPNPAYVNVLALLSMVWLMAYLRLTRQPDDGRPLAGVLLLGSAAGILLLVGGG
jgi:hypothetical protein